jgi:hypothetical protein
MLRFHTQGDDLFRIANESANRIRDLDDLIGGEQPLQIGDYLCWRIVAAGKNYIGPRKGGFGSFGKHNTACVVSNIGHQFFGKSSLTGQIKSNLESKPASIDLGIA